jgi:esterase
MAGLIDHTIELSNLTFHYREAGGPSTPPVILLHALGLDAHDWDDIACTLAEETHVFALDLRGHGQSARADIYSFETMRDDLKAFVDAFSLNRFTLIGHSMGATVALLFAERWPERVERLVIEDTPPPHGNSALPDLPDEPPETIPLNWQRNWQAVKSIVRQLYTPDPSWWNDLSKITAPTLLIGGGSTSHVPQQKLAEVAHLIPDCRLVTIEGAGHNVHQSRPEEYKALLRDFLFP